MHGVSWGKGGNQPVHPERQRDAKLQPPPETGN